MPAKNETLHGNVPDQSAVALLLIDLINDLEYPGGDQLFKHALPAAKQTAALKQKAREANVPVIYVNDNYGKWQSDLSKLVEHCLNDKVRGQPIVELLKPDRNDYFVLKPKHSGFYSTTLDVLLTYLNVKTLVLTGIAGNSCVLFTANDAYMRDYNLIVPQDCIASIDPLDNQHALELMQKMLKAQIIDSATLDWNKLKQEQA